ncbi:sigma-54 interaction domain-containing protein [Planococcus sp. 1R117A]|uniref:sigma-54 interaction domain-containing protein n=1 Tax=Planococcus sp. 1R117A TaxID=3447020 RepID=UPI003EDC4564
MLHELDNFDRLADFDNVLVVDEDGKTLYYDLADLNVLAKLGHRPEDFLGKKITSFYTNLTDDNSTVMNVLKKGTAVTGVSQKMMTKTGSMFISKSSTYPISENGRVVGAVEFSKHYYSKEDMQYLDQYNSHKVYRKNNTGYTIDDIITRNHKMLKIKDKMVRIAKHNSTVLIYGETGTGKAVIAQAIHNLSNRFAKPFISVHCGALPEHLVEREFWGTEKNEAAGIEESIGFFEQAEGGTLFLDEIHSLDPHLQAKLLNAIEQKSIRKIGGATDVQLDIRIISATNENPDLLIEQKRMREDLYYRLGVIQLELPELKDRKDDLDMLVSRFIAFYNERMDMNVEGIEPEVLEYFRTYNWPGNIRELKNAIETAFNTAEDKLITLEDIPPRIRKANHFSGSTENKRANMDLKEVVDDYEKSIILTELQKSNGVIAEAARRLGVSKQTLKYKLSKYELR